MHRCARNAAASAYVRRRLRGASRAHSGAARLLLRAHDAQPTIGAGAVAQPRYMPRVDSAPSPGQTGRCRLPWLWQRRHLPRALRRRLQSAVHVRILRPRAPRTPAHGDPDRAGRHHPLWLAWHYGVAYAPPAGIADAILQAIEWRAWCSARCCSARACTRSPSAAATSWHHGPTAPPDLSRPIPARATRSLRRALPVGGRGVLFQSWLYAAVAAGFLMVISLVFVPLLEEPQLEARFGDDYRRYRRHDVAVPSPSAPVESGSR